VVVDVEGEVRLGRDLEVRALPPVAGANADDALSSSSPCTQTSVTSPPSLKRCASSVRVVVDSSVIESPPSASVGRSVARGQIRRLRRMPWSTHWVALPALPGRAPLRMPTPRRVCDARPRSPAFRPERRAQDSTRNSMTPPSRLIPRRAAGRRRCRRSRCVARRAPTRQRLCGHRRSGRIGASASPAPPRAPPTSGAATPRCRPSTR
jgi:hypothetical protein